MKLMANQRTRILFAVLCCCFYGPIVFGQTSGAPKVPQAVVAGGGGTSSNPNVQIAGTAGQSATATSSVGAYAISSGFWAGMAPLPCALAVTDVSGTFGGSAILTARLTGGGSNVSNKLITFTLNGSSVGSATTDVNGVAALGVSVAGINAGTYPGAVAAEFAGDTSFLASVSTGALTVDKANPHLQVRGGIFTYDGQSHAALVSATGIGNVALTPLTVIYNGVASVPINAGNYIVSVSYAGDQNYNSIADNQQSIVINRAGQTITFGTLINKIFGDGPFNVDPTSSVGLPVSVTVLSGPATINGHTVTVNGAGTVTLRAAQPGDANHDAATPVDQAFAVTKGDQTINFATLSQKNFGDPDFPVSATSTSGLAVSFGASGSCNVVGNSVHIMAAGSCTITASQGGNANVSAAQNVAQSFQIGKAATATSLSSSLNQSAVGQPVMITATVTSVAGTPTGVVQFKADGADLGAAMTLGSGGAATFTSSGLGAGTHTITADYLGDANFNASIGTLSRGQVVGGIINFSQLIFVAGERDGAVAISVRRSGDTTGAISVDYATDDGSIPTVALPCSTATGMALERCDYTRAAGTLHFAPGEIEKTFTVLVNDDSYTEGVETLRLVLSQPLGGASLGPQAVSTVQIVDDVSESAGNPVDEDRNYVIQQYHDFLNREPDPDGLKFWTNEITSCGADLQCREIKRINVSAAFFLSIEFQETGYLVERMYKAVFADANGSSNLPVLHQLPVPLVRLPEFLRDTQEIGRGVVVGQGPWQQQLEAKKQGFLLEFVSRQTVAAALPLTLNAEQFVTQLDQNAGEVLTAADKAQLEGVFGGPSAVTSDATKRAQVLRAVAENATLQQREFNRAFVLMQYFGYLRRSPNDAQDTDHTGYDFWLRKLDQFAGDFVRAEMVKAFISSAEYRRRFGQ